MSIISRRLATALGRIETLRIERPDWDTAEGEAFIREVMAAEHDGHDIEDIARELGIPNLRYVVRARERFLR